MREPIPAKKIILSLIILSLVCRLPFFVAIYYRMNPIHIQGDRPEVPLLYVVVNYIPYLLLTAGSAIMFFLLVIRFRESYQKARRLLVALTIALCLYECGDLILDILWVLLTDRTVAFIGRTEFYIISGVFFIISLILLQLGKNPKVTMIIAVVIDLLLSALLMFFMILSYSETTFVFGYLLFEICFVSYIGSLTFAGALFLFLIRNPLPYLKNPPVTNLSISDIEDALNRINTDWQRGLIDDTEYQKRRYDLLGRM